MLIDATRHQAPDGTLYAVRELRGRKRLGAPSRRWLDVQISKDGGESWAPVLMRVCPLHLHRASASDWPPPGALMSSLSEDHRLTIEYDSVYDPWARARPTRLQTHARWQARYDPRFRWWTLQQLRLYGPEASASR